MSPQTLQSNGRFALFLRAFRRTDAGGAALEFAVVIPVLVLLGIGVVDFGRAFFTGIAVANAARAGAQWGAHTVDASGKPDSMRIVAENDAQDIGSITVTTNRVCKCTTGVGVDCAGTCPTVGYEQPEVFVTVAVSKTVNFILRYPGIPQSMTFRDSATFRAQ
jgi:Flp pilus assembly protein TadG